MKFCIIGTGDAGAIAALQIRRLDDKAQIDVFSKREELGVPPCEMPLVLSGAVSRWEDLFRGFRGDESFYKKRNINLHLNTEVTEILRPEKYVIAGGERYSYDKLILSLGASPIIPPIPGLGGRNEFTLSTDLADGRTLEKAIQRYKTAAVVGGGFIALEIAAALKSRGYERVYLLIRRDIMRAYLEEDMAEKLKQVIVESGVELILPTEINRVESRNGRKHIILSDQEQEVDFIFFGTGMKPNVELARKAGLELGETGAIEVNQFLQTSDPDIYAAGDCMENWEIITSSKRRHHLATNAIRNGYIAGRNAVLGNRIIHEGTVMPFVTKIFGYQVGSVGFTKREARERGLDAVSVNVRTSWLRKRFGGKPAWYRFIGEKKTKRLIGAQIISEEIVSGTVDKLAVAIVNKMPLMKLVQVDSCYSPYVQEDQIAVPLQGLIDALG